MYFLNYHTCDLAMYIAFPAPFLLVNISGYDNFPPMWHVEENGYISSFKKQSFLSRVKFLFATGLDCQLPFRKGACETASKGNKPRRDNGKLSTTVMVGLMSNGSQMMRICMMI